MMKVYNFLFAVVYEMELRRGEKDMLYMWPLAYVLIVVANSIFTLMFVFARLFNFEAPHGKIVLYTIGACVGIVLAIYYLRGGRYKRIHEKYRTLVKKRRRIMLLLIGLTYIIASALLMMFAGMYYNHFWIFK